ncbi:MAG: T9SS type A sorting domain-containing protein [Bacteroidia bacterium]
MKKTATHPFIFALTLLSLLSLAPAYAQVATMYTFSQDTIPYSRITGGTVLASGTEDDQTYTNRPIGFTFSYNNTAYTSFGVSPNGFIVLGSGNVSTSYAAISSSGNGNLISAMCADLQLGYRFVGTATNMSNILAVTGSTIGIFVGAKIIGNGIPNNTTVVSISGQNITMSQNATQNTSAVNYTAGGEMRYETIGNAPNRVCVIQWTTIMKFIGNGIGDCFNFQIRLHETSGKIETTYNILAVNQNQQSIQVGLRGTTNADFNSRETTNNWQTTTATSASNGICNLNVQFVPLSGLTFIWTNGNVGMEESSAFAFTLFPNPCQENCQIEFEQPTHVYTVEIFSATGQLIYQENSDQLCTRLLLDFNAYSSGIYFVRVTTAAGTSTKRILVD